MRKKRRLVQIKPDEAVIHPVGQERFICVQKYTGDLPVGEPVDWFVQPEEQEPPDAAASPSSNPSNPPEPV